MEQKPGNSAKSMFYNQQQPAFPMDYLRELQGEILSCPYLAINNLNRDFVGTKGFSVVFVRSEITTVEQRFPYFSRYLEQVIQPDCNAFYLNPLLLTTGSRVEPHIDRSLRSYCKTIEPPSVVSVLYIQVPTDLEGGELVLQWRKRQVGKIRPQVNTLVLFQGYLTHSVKAMRGSGMRLSLVCEQYSLESLQLEEIPKFKLESRAIRSKKGWD